MLILEIAAGIVLGVLALGVLALAIRYWQVVLGGFVLLVGGGALLIWLFSDPRAANELGSWILLGLLAFFGWQACYSIGAQLKKRLSRTGNLGGG